MQPAHKKIVENWLVKHPDVRLATDGDCGCKDDIEAIRKYDSFWKNTDFHPYYAVGDFNDDGQEDFAVAVIEKHPRKFLTVLIFNGPFKLPKIRSRLLFVKRCLCFARQYFITQTNPNRID